MPRVSAETRVRLSMLGFAGGEATLRVEGESCEEVLKELGRCLSKGGETVLGGFVSFAARLRRLNIAGLLRRVLPV